MKSKNKEINLDGSRGPVKIRRNEHGIPEITGDSLADVAFGQGYMHALDRQLQVLLTRLLVQGRMAELLLGDQELVEYDRFIRRINFLPDPETVIAGLLPETREWLDSYIAGFNLSLKSNGTIFEFKLLGYRPEPLTLKDILLSSKVLGFLGLSDAQLNAEKLIIQMIQNGINEKMLKELFPYIKEKIDYKTIEKVTLNPPVIPSVIKWLWKLPRFKGSNNWVVSGDITESGRPILCSDPHVEVNRAPALWYESVLRLPGNTILGSGLPGSPAIVIGRNSKISWGITYAYMDMVDYRIEECRDGKYRRSDGWHTFEAREEKIIVKGKETITDIHYENEHGVLEGDPYKEGHYLVMKWGAAKNCGWDDFNGYRGLPVAGTAREGMSLCREMTAGSWNFVFADIDGNIGYQMCGRTFKRPPHVSGLIPLPAWEKKHDGKGFVKSGDLPSLYNPREKMIVTANNDLNHIGKAKPINLSMASYRAERIEQLLKQKKKHNVSSMKDIQYDLFSIQSELLMKVIRPMLPDTPNGKILREWDCVYRDESRGAMLFESVYRRLLESVFGEGGIGMDVLCYILDETPVFSDYYGNFDAILLKKNSSWFDSRERDKIFRTAIELGLSANAEPYGKTRRLKFNQIFFDGKLPAFLGFDHGPIAIPGSRSTVLQGQIFKNGGRTSTDSPAYRMITDMARNEIHTNIPGGPSDRRFSKWYGSDLKNWTFGHYKVLK